MRDRDVLIIAAAVVGGAWWARSVPWWIVLPLLGLSAFTRRPWLFGLTLGLLTSSLSSHAWRALDRELPPRVDAVATVVRDPALTSFGKHRGEIDVDGRRYQLTARAREDDATLARLLSGDRVVVRGDVAPLTGPSRSSLRRRHVAGRVAANDLRLVDHGTRHARVVNALRSELHAGAAPMAGDRRALLMGLLLGDDRDQSSSLTDAFRASGLSHLLAVSGGNVAFVLLLFAPAFRRWSLRGRLVGGLAVLVVFGALTRWEPSVIRAECMAAVTLFASYVGTPVSTRRVLALAVITSLLLDPFLIGSIGFLLSVTACIGMATFGPRLLALIPGPRWLASTLAYSAAAQLGVAPVQWIVFGGLPVVGLASNVLAEPAAGFVMAWGMLAAGVSGLLGPTVGAVLHLPTTVALWWIEQVARRSAGTNLGSWSLADACMAIAALVALSARRRQMSHPSAGSRRDGVPSVRTRRDVADDDYRRPDDHAAPGVPDQRGRRRPRESRDDVTSRATRR